MNKWCATARFTKDIEVRYSQGANATAIARSSIAVPRKFKKEGEPDADFFNVVAFGKTAEFLEKYFGKGKQIAIVGRVENDNYTDKDGKKVYGTRIFIEECDFCGNKEDSTTEGQKTQNKANNEVKEGFMNIPDGVDEELPFN